jgi:hypothetical protein
VLASTSFLSSVSWSMVHGLSFVIILQPFNADNSILDSSQFNSGCN